MEKLTETIRVRVGATLKTKAEKLANILTRRQPAGARAIKVADIARMSLEEFVSASNGRKAT